MPNVTVIQLGPEVNDLKINKIVAMVSRAQSYYSFSEGDALGRLIEPRGDGSYKAADLMSHMMNIRNNKNIDVLIGVVDSPLYDDLFSAVDYDNECIVISTQGNGIRDLLMRTNHSIYGYVLVEIAAQLLTIEYRRAKDLSVDPEDCELPWHRETRKCVFDYSDYAPDTMKKLAEPNLCHPCRALLSDANVGDSAISATVRIVNLGLRRRIYTVIGDVMRNPALLFLFGGFLGGFIMDWAMELMSPHVTSPRLLIVSVMILVLVAAFWRVSKKSPSLNGR